MPVNITESIEYFEPINYRFPEVTLLDANDSFTHNLVQAFLSIGSPVRVFRSHESSIEEIKNQLGSYLVLSPGPGVPSEAGIMKEVFREFCGKLPILGVCLGMQAINEIFGGETVPSKAPLHGKTSSIPHDGTGIFDGIQSPTVVARYHSLRIKGPFRNFEIQSKYDDCIMAIHNPSMQFAGVQFHPESFMTIDGNRMLLNFLELKI